MDGLTCLYSLLPAAVRVVHSFHVHVSLSPIHVCCVFGACVRVCVCVCACAQADEAISPMARDDVEAFALHEVSPIYDL